MKLPVLYRLLVWLVFVFFSFSFGFDRQLVFPLSRSAEAKEKIFFSWSRIYFLQEQAVISLRLNNQSIHPLFLKAEAQMKNGLGKTVWEKDFALGQLGVQEAVELEFNWPAEIDLIGRPSLEINLKDQQDNTILNQKFAFLVLPGFFGSAALVSLAFLSTKGVGRILSLV